MPHLTDRTLAAALDAENGGAVGDVARVHAAQCDACGALLSAGRSDPDAIGSLLQRLDHPVPKISAQQLAVLAAEPRLANRTASSSWMPRSRPLYIHPRLRWGVGVGLFGVAAVAAALVPRSPMYDLVTHMLGRAPASSRSAPARSSTALLPPGADKVAASRGVVINPTGPTNIIFRSMQHAGVIRVAQSATGQISVEASGDGPSYSVGANTITVENSAADSASYDVEIPPPTDGVNVRVHLGDRVLYAQLGKRVLTHMSHRPDGLIVISLH